MKRLTKLVALLVPFMVGCEYFEVHPYDTDITGERDIIKRNIKQIESLRIENNEFRFAVISDTQGFYDQLKTAVECLNEIDDLDFVLHCGDLTDYGLKREFENQRDILLGLNVPWVTVIGNHDCLASGYAIYNEIFGSTDYAFTVGNSRFICLNTNYMEFGCSTHIPNLDFISEQVGSLRDDIRQVIYVMHIAPGILGFNNSVKDSFQNTIKQTPKLPFCLYGHCHRLSVDDLLNDGVLYYQCPNIEKRTILLFTMHATDYEYETICF